MKEKLIVKCASCGKDKKIFPYLANRNQRHFCNRKCQQEWRERTAVHIPKPKNCKTCKAPMKGKDILKAATDNRYSKKCKKCRGLQKDNSSKRAEESRAKFIKKWNKMEWEK